ncbi:hypothetical protein LZT27_07755 [Aeromonas veronii]|nr:hypothetical protein [Aeromonas veronii]MDD1844482.1 hypothetical protein [Aeromonas veronii]
MPKMSDHRFLTRLTWLLFAVVILLIGLTLRQSLKQIERLYQSDTLNSAIYLRDRFKQTEVFLEAMRGQAEERLRSDPRSVLTRQLYRHIEVLPEGLALDKLPGDLPAGLAGNLTGDGPLPPPGSAREAQLHLALASLPCCPLPASAWAARSPGPTSPAWTTLSTSIPGSPPASFALPAASMTSTTGRMR